MYFYSIEYRNKSVCQDTQHTTDRPAHHTPICPANLGCPECPEAPAVPATPRSRRAGQGSGSLGSAHPGARERADEARRALHRSGRPNLPRPQPSGARPVTSGSDPAGRCRAGEAHLCQRRGLRFQPRRAGSKGAGVRAHRGPGVHAGLGLHGSVGQRLRLRLRLRPRLSPRGFRCGDAGAGVRRGKRRRTRLGTERLSARQQRAVPWHAERAYFWEM